MIGVEIYTFINFSSLSIGRSWIKKKKVIDHLLNLPILRDGGMLQS
jgi:hypothetical protein